MFFLVVTKAIPLGEIFRAILRADPYWAMSSVECLSWRRWALPRLSEARNNQTLTRQAASPFLRVPPNRQRLFSRGNS